MKISAKMPDFRRAYFFPATNFLLTKHFDYGIINMIYRKKEAIF